MVSCTTFCLLLGLQRGKAPPLPTNATEMMLQAYSGTEQHDEGSDTTTPLDTKYSTSVAARSHEPDCVIALQSKLIHAHIDGNELPCEALVSLLGH